VRTVLPPVFLNKKNYCQNQKFKNNERHETLHETNKYMGWMVKLVAHQLAKEALWVKIKTTVKNKKMGDISKGVDTLSSPQKEYKIYK
jgi:hypothetical protein